MARQAFSEAALAAGIREVTDDEVAFYQDYGWVKLDGLVAPEIVEVLRAESEPLLRPHENSSFSDLDCPGAVLHMEPFQSFVLSKQMGRVAHRLINRSRLTGAEVPTRIRDDLIQRRDPDSRGIDWHQDSSEHGSDRVGEFNGWLALAEVTPDMGAMRFLTGVHREGPLGTAFGEGQHLLTIYPRLLDLYEFSPPLHYQPGDMTVHHGYMIHGGPPHSSDKPRWSYLISYAPADTRYWHGTTGNHGSKRVPLTDDAVHPIVYP